MWFMMPSHCVHLCARAREVVSHSVDDGAGGVHDPREDGAAVTVPSGEKSVESGGDTNEAREKSQFY